METQNWLIKQAQLNPDRLAVSDGQTSYTFAQLLTVVKADAAHLAGLTTQTRVGLLGKNNLLTYRLALALLSMGKTIVWLNWRLASPELAFQVADSELDLVLTH